jgi:hypothetical protein
VSFCNRPFRSAQRDFCRVGLMFLVIGSHQYNQQPVPTHRSRLTHAGP